MIYLIRGIYGVFFAIATKKNWFIRGKWIDSYNFCPYLEAVKKLKLETKIICKKVGEPSIQKMCEMIHSKLKFSRNYHNIRPKNKKYCEEYIEIKK